MNPHLNLSKKRVSTRNSAAGKPTGLEEENPDSFSQIISNKKPHHTRDNSAPAAMAPAT